MDESLKALEEKVTNLSSLVVSLGGQLSDSLPKIDSNFGLVIKRLEAIEIRIDALEKSSTKEFKQVGGSLSEIKEEIQKINLTTGYADQFENMKGL
jgi:hypothetical protein